MRLTDRGLLAVPVDAVARNSARLAVLAGVGSRNSARPAVSVDVVVRSSACLAVIGNLAVCWNFRVGDSARLVVGSRCASCNRYIPAIRSRCSGRRFCRGQV